jgi:hypothetical protein
LTLREISRTTPSRECYNTMAVGAWPYRSAGKAQGEMLKVIGKLAVLCPFALVSLSAVRPNGRPRMAPGRCSAPLASTGACRFREDQVGSPTAHRCELLSKWDAS